MVQEILMEMAKHPSLVEREIPFVILANKRDLEDSLEADVIRKVI